MKKIYRDSFLDSTVRGLLALQIRALRQQRGLSQDEFAQLTGKKQSVISRLEDPTKNKASIETLLEIAKASDVALLVKFVSYPELLQQTSDVSPDALAVETIFESVELSAHAPVYDRIVWKGRSERSTKTINMKYESGALRRALL